LAASHVHGRLPRVRIQGQAGGGGKTRAIKNVVCTLRNHKSPPRNSLFVK
jgi:hypothetical protein